MNRFAKVAFASTVVVLALAAALPWRAVVRAVRSRVASGHAETVAASRAPVPAAPRWDVGIQQDYDLDLRASVTSRSQSLITAEIRGSLAIIPLTAGPRQLMRCSFDGGFTTLSGAAAGQPSPTGATAPPEFAQGLRKPWFIELDGDGRYVALRHDPSVPNFVGRLWQAVAASLQISRSGIAADQQSTVVEETDSTGRYRAEYRRIGTTEHERRKVDYVSVANSRIHYHVLSSKTAIRFDGDDRLSLMNVDEVVKTDGTGPIPELTTTTHEALVWKGSRTPLETVALLLASANGAVSTPAGNALHDETRAAEIESAQIGGRTYPDVVASLVEEERAIRAGTETKEQKQKGGRAYVALTALLRRQPEHLAALQEHVEKRGPLTGALLDALRDAGTPAAQNVLADVLKSGKLERTARLSAVEGLSQVAAPTAETVRTLRELESDKELGNQATYGLGSNAFRLQGQNPTLAESIVKELLARLSAAETEDERALVLTALGNAGDPSTLDAVRTFLVPPYSAVVRAAAAQALRRIRGDAADALVAAAAQDAEATVRFSAVDVISERPVSGVLISALETILLNDSEVNVRMKAVQTAAGWVPESRDLATVLGTVSQRDPSEDIRRIARNALARHAAG